MYRRTRLEVNIEQQSNVRMVDASVMERLRRLGGDELIGKMVDLFVQYAEPMLGRVVASCEAGNPDELERAAHSLKSSAGNLGAREVESLAGSIERLAAEHSLEAIRPIVTELEKAFLRAKACLDEEKRGLTR
ncbi:MAG TPA: Hpt domain-containing protein [Acidobacteriota bacterium]|nr:Hpt domain-containing protein [Acidobacteriota bacterium]